VRSARSKHRRGGALTIGLIATAVLVGSCRRNPGPGSTAAPSAVLRVGVAQLSATDPGSGLRQLAQLLAVESLVRTGEDGRMQPWLAQSWARDATGRVLTLKLRPHVTFHDGSPADAATVSQLLPDVLRAFMGPIFSDVEYVKPSGTDSVVIGFREASPFLLEALEASIQKPGPGTIGTGPFQVVPNSTAEMRANASYDLGPPKISAIHVQAYPSVRAAWAELLRDQLDMLWEVGSVALESMKGSSQISVFTYTRRYQHAVVFNPDAPALRDPEIRRALNFAVDRAAVVRGALEGYGIASSGPIWPRHWAVQRELPRFDFDPKRAAEMMKRHRPTPFRFTCLVSPDSVDERIALEVKRQLAAIGVDMVVEESAREDIMRRGASHQFEAAIIEVISGPTLVRPYLMWHSNSPRNWGRLGNATIDLALDRVRHATSESAYQTAAVDLQNAFIANPPAIFLAWSQQSRAVSKRFAVQPEEGRDVLSTIRMWKPVQADARASRN
jgi:peptide/nickel transport system substrate-binding protein